MTARCVPERPSFRATSEERVWRELRRHLRDEDLLMANVRFTALDGDWEVDLVVGMPDAGFAVIEVKGGQVWRDGGQWWQRTAEGARPLDLEDQVTSGKYLLGRYLMRHPRWTQGRQRMVHMVALPDSTLGPEDPSPGLPRAWIADRSELAGLAGRLHDLLRSPLPTQPNAVPGADAIDLAAEVLGGRGDPQAQVARVVAVLGEHCDRLTEAQFRVLDLARRIPRYEVVGGPGTGKTWLAMEQARRWAAEGHHVALVCYSRGLSTWMARRVAGWPTDVRERVRVRTFHALGVDWGVRIADGRGRDYWERELPEQMRALAEGLPDADRFDALVVDEAQDVPTSWWAPLLGALRDAERARIAVFTDEQQRIFDRLGRPGLDLVPLDLAENLRNSRQIGAAFAPLADRPPRLLGGEGPPVRFVRARPADAMAVADEQAVRLLDEGWAPGDVAVLTTHHRHPEQQNRVALDGRDGYWESFWDSGDMFFSTVAAFKGLERPAVVLAVDGFRDDATAREVLYVGLSRARDMLVVVGDPAVIRRVGGDAVADRIVGPLPVARRPSRSRR